MEVNGVKLFAASAQQFEKSLAVRPCSYDPRDQLELMQNDNGSMCVIMPLSCKRLWFFTYCAEHSVNGNISLEHSDPIFNIGSANGFPLGFISASAKVFIDGEQLGEGHAGQAIVMDSVADISNCIQAVTGLAQSRALTNAGFGAVDRFSVECNTGPDASLTGSGDDLPFVGGEDVHADNSPAESETRAFCGPVPSSQNDSQSLFAMLGGKNDPLTRAKQVAYPLIGKVQNVPLGEVQDRYLKYLVNHGDPKVPAVASAIEAAKLILAEREKMVKSVPQK